MDILANLIRQVKQAPRCFSKFTADLDRDCTASETLILDPKNEPRISADCRSTRWKAANQLRLCITVCQRSLHGGHPKSLDCRSGRCLSAAWHMEDCDPVVPKALYGWDSLVVDPEWVHCMGKGSKYFYLWNSLQGS